MVAFQPDRKDMFPTVMLLFQSLRYSKGYQNTDVFQGSRMVIIWVGMRRQLREQI